MVGGLGQEMTVEVEHAPYLTVLGSGKLEIAFALTGSAG